MPLYGYFCDIFFAYKLIGSYMYTISHAEMHDPNIHLIRGTEMNMQSIHSTPQFPPE